MMSSSPLAGCMKINIFRALNLEDNHLLRKNDPYVKVYFDTMERREAEKGKYEENDDGKNPIFDLEFSLRLEGRERFVIVEVCGRELLKDSILGVAKIPLEDLSKHIGGTRFSVPLLSKEGKASAGSVILSVVMDEDIAKIRDVQQPAMKDELKEYFNKDIKDRINVDELVTSKDISKDLSKDKDLIKDKEFDKDRIVDKDISKDSLADSKLSKDLPATEVFQPHHELSRGDSTSLAGVADKSEEIFKPHHELPRDESIGAAKSEEIFKPHHELPRDDSTKVLEREVQGLNLEQNLWNNVNLSSQQGVDKLK